MWIGGFCRMLGSSSVLKAEAWGLLEGIRFASTLALDSLEIECDSKVIVDSVSDRCLICPEIATIVGAIRSHLASFHCWRIKHIWSEANRCADCLACLGCQQDSSDVRIYHEPPLEVLRFLQPDLLSRGDVRLIRV